MRLVLMIVRGMFIALSIWLGVHLSGLLNAGGKLNRYMTVWILATVSVAVAITFLDFLFSRKFVMMVTAVVFGLLLGFLTAGLVSTIIFTIFPLPPPNMEITSPDFAIYQTYATAIKTTLLCVFCYLGVSFVVQTRNDFRFIIPYIQFSRKTKGIRPLILDTSVIIDGRIADILETRIVDSPVIVPKFVLNELHSIADSADKLKRNRGRRGLDMLNRMQGNPLVEVLLDDSVPTDPENVDQSLVNLVKDSDGFIVTNDFNLNKVATLQGVPVININEVAKALKPVFIPGENFSVKVIKRGEEPDQGVGYLDDGTMVVVENGKTYMGKTVAIIVTSLLQTNAGRMIFGKPKE